MPFHSKAVANYLLGLGQRDGVALSPMKMIKLVYIAHGWHLWNFDRPLINEQIEAWPYGPVIASLYHEFKRYGNKPIEEPAVHLSRAAGDKRFYPYSMDGEQSQSHRDEARNLIDAVWNIYKGFSAVQLSAKTHHAGSPWFQTWHTGGGRETRGTDIPQEDIKKHFTELAGE